MLHLLCFWFGESLAVTFSGLLSASEHMCCICFVFGLLCLWSEPDISIFHGVVIFSWADCGVQGRRSKLLMLPRVHLLPCPTLHSARTVPVQCPHSAGPHREHLSCSCEVYGHCLPPASGVYLILQRHIMSMLLSSTLQRGKQRAGQEQKLCLQSQPCKNSAAELCDFRVSTLQTVSRKH